MPMHTTSYHHQHGLPVRRRITWLVLAATLLVVSAGCSDNPAPDPIEGSSTSAGSSPSSDPSPSGAPTLPPAARGTSKQAAIAFVRYYVRVLNFAALSLDPTRIRALSSRSCSACKGIADSVARIAKHDGRIIGGAWTVVEPRVVPAVQRQMTQVQMVVSYPEQTVHETADSKPIHFDAGRTFYAVELRHTVSGWKVNAIRSDA